MTSSTWFMDAAAMCLASGVALLGDVLLVRRPSLLERRLVALLRPADHPGAPAFLILERTRTAVRGRAWILRLVARRRARDLLVDLPVAAECLALAMVSGHEPWKAMALAAERCRGSLGVELHGVARSLRGGTPLVQALADLADRLDVPVLTRFAEGVTDALDRREVAVDALCTQAVDVRRAVHEESARRARRRDLLVAAATAALTLTIPLIASSGSLSVALPR